MKRPIMFITTFLCLGIMTNYYFQNVISVVMIFIGVFLINYFLYCKSKHKFTMILYVFFIIGYIITINKISIDLESTHNIEGYVYDIQPTSYSTKLFISVYSIDNKNEDTKIILTTYDENVNKYDKIQCTSNLEYLNRNNFEYAYYKSKNISYKGYTDDIEIIGYEHNINYYLSFISDKIASVYDTIFPSEESAVLKALVLGDKNYLDENIQQIYKVGGIFHILSLSGLHIAILSAFIMYLLKFIIRGCKKNIITICFLIIYLILTGASVSTTRAVIMASCLLIAPCVRREYDMLSGISLAGFIILFFRPFSLFTVSFILTFSSVLSICLLSPKISSFINYYAVKTNNSLLLILNKEIDVLAPVLSIFLVLSIILAYYFYEFYPYGIFVNIIILPFVSPLIILSFLCGIIGIFNIGIASFIGSSVYYLLLFLEFVCNIFGRLPFSDILVGKPTLAFIIFYFVSLIILFFVPKYKIRFISILTIVFIIVCINNNYKTSIRILDNQVFINNKEIVLLDSTTNSFYNNNDYILSKGNRYVSTIVTDSLGDTKYLLENDMLGNVYIRDDNENLNILKENGVSNIIEINGDEKFKIDNNIYCIDNNNIYFSNGNLSFSSIKNVNNMYNTNVQNVNEYGIIIYNKDGKAILNSNDLNVNINFVGDKIVVR